MWTYKQIPVEQIPERVVGFVYVITCLVNGKQYIGKKLTKFSKTTYKTITQKNGLKKRKKIKSQIDSDWQIYWGSSELLKKDILEYGEQAFRREILHWCYSKSECSYMEAREQFDRRVLESNLYYNNYIQLRVNGNQICKAF